MKQRFNLFHAASALAILSAMPAMALDYQWRGTTNATWNTATNWLLQGATTTTAPTTGGTYTNDRLLIMDGTGADAVYNPGTGVTTTFGGDRGILIGTSGFTGALTVQSGILRTTGGTNNPLMANGVNATLLINGGTLDVSSNNTNFLQIFNGTAGVQSTISISNGGSFIGNGFDLTSNQNTANNSGVGVINLDGGTFAVRRILRTITAGTGTSTLNFNGGVLQARASDTTFFSDLYNTTAVVKSGGARVDTNTFNITIGEILTQDSALGATLDGGLAKTGSGTLTLSGTNTYTGGTTISNPDDTSGIVVANASALGTGSVLVNGAQQFNPSLSVNGGLTANNALTLRRGVGTSTFRAVLGLGASSNWSGNITLDNTSANGFAAISAGGTDAATASIVSGNIGFSTLGSAAQPALVLRGGGRTGKVTGSISLSTGTVQFLDATQWEFSNASNTWGRLDINNAGAIATVGAVNTLSSTGVVSSTVGGTLRLNDLAATTAFSQTIAGLDGNVNVGLSTGSATLTLNTSADQSSSGGISGAISLVKSGSARQTLSGANTYTGTTTVNGGTLALGTTGTISSGDLTVSSATLDLRRGTSTRVPDVANLNLSSATLAIGLNASADGLNVIGAAILSGTNTVKLYGSIAAGTYTLISTPSPLAGTLTLDTSGVTVSGFTGSYTAVIDGNNYVLTVGGTATPGTAYWHGDVSSVWNDASVAPGSNWANDGSGSSDTAQLPGAISDVYFSTATATNTNTTLGADISINSLTFESGTASVGGANTLSILATAGNALDVLNGATATLNTATTAIAGTAAVQEGGTLTLNGGGLGSGTLLVDGTLNLNMSIANAVLNGSANGNISRTISGTSTLSITGSTNSSYAGTLSDGSGILALAKTGTSTLTLSGVNTFSGGTSLTNGLMVANTSGALGTGSIVFSGSSQRLSLGNDVTLTNSITLGANNGVQGAALLEPSTTVFGAATLEGPVSITANPFGGGHFGNRSNGAFNVKGAINSSVVVVHRIGTVTYWGGGSYTSMRVTGTAALGADNGLATNASLSIGVSGAGTFDLAGYNQSLAGILKDVNAATIGNSSTTADSLLTITGTSNYGGVIRDTLGSGTRKTGLTVNGGSLTLGGLNTYTGNTTINSGALTLADNAQLRFAIGATSGSNNTLTGASATLNGDFNIDTSLADASALTSGTWTLESVTSLSGAYGSTFQVLSGSTAWTVTGDKWSKTVGAKTYTFDETTGVLTLTSDGFDSWIASKGLTGLDAAFDADPDNDGIDNGLEFVLGGEPNPANPGSNSASLLPIVSQSSGDLIFTFKRKDLSESGLTLKFQWSTDLTFPSPANDIPIGAVDLTTDTITVDVTEDSPDADTDTIVITVPAAKASSGKLFGRLNAAMIP